MQVNPIQWLWQPRVSAFWTAVQWQHMVQQCQCPTIPMVMSRSLGTCDGTFANTPNVPCACIRPGCWLRSEPPSGSWQREEQRLDKVDRCFFFISPMHRDLWIQREIKHKKDCGTWWKLQWGSRWFYKHWSVGILIRFFGYIIYIYSGILEQLSALTFKCGMARISENYLLLWQSCGKASRPSSLFSYSLRIKDYRNLGENHYTQFQSVSGRDMSDTWTWTHDKLAAHDHENCNCFERAVPKPRTTNKAVFAFPRAAWSL